MRCTATTSKRRRCKANALSGSKKCLFHSNLRTVKKGGKTYYRKGNRIMSKKALEDDYMKC